MKKPLQTLIQGTNYLYSQYTYPKINACLEMFSAFMFQLRNKDDNKNLGAKAETAYLVQRKQSSTTSPLKEPKALSNLASTSNARAGMFLIRLSKQLQKIFRV